MMTRKPPGRGSVWLGVLVGLSVLVSNVALGNVVYTLAYEWALPTWGFVVVTVLWVLLASPAMGMTAMSVILWTITGHWRSPPRIIRDGYRAARERRRDIM